MNIRQLRNEMGMTQSVFAMYFKIPIRTIQEWEQGRRKPPQYLINLLSRIARLEKQIL